MDILKLLTRSSNLQKSGPTVNHTYHQQIPSAGTSSQGKFVFETDFVLPKGEILYPRKDKKRKRAEGHEHGLDRHESQDFSSAGVERSQPHPHLSSTESHEQNAGKANDGRVGSTPAMTEAECRRVLKQHKLKITLLNTEIIPKATLLKKNGKDQVSQRDTCRKDTFTQLTPIPLISFRQLRAKYGTSKRLAENLDYQGYLKPTEVQMGSLPILLGTDEDRGLPLRGPSKKTHQRSEVDLLTVAPTGSGKTLAFLIQIIQGLLEDPQRRKKSVSSKEKEREGQALIIAPTHELADQIVNEGRKLVVGTGLRISGLKKGTKLGGLPPLSREDGQHQSSSRTERETPEPVPGFQEEPLVKADILVSTPMMLVNSISSPSEPIPKALPRIRYLVLDEADILLDPLFRAQTLSIWSSCSNPHLKTSLWSATIGSSIESLAISFINDRRRNLNLLPSKPPTHHIIRLVVGLKDSAVSNISHRLIYTATEQGKLLALRQMLHPAAVSAGDAPSIQPPFLVFAQTIPRAIALHSELLYDIPLEAGGSSRIAVLHSDLSVTVRAAIMAGFRRGEVWILITTDLLSRGVDFRGVNGVVNYDIPNTGAAYIHRVGRTGRQQREGGIAVTFYTKEDIPYVKNIANVISRSERVKSKDGNGEKQAGVEKWLLDALPPLSKKTKQDLKRKGVEIRRDNNNNNPVISRADNDNNNDDAARRKIKIKTRISTKSGYDRKLEHRHQEAIARTRRRAVNEERRRRSPEFSGDGDGVDEEWAGIRD